MLGKSAFRIFWLHGSYLKQQSLKYAEL
jgi:hypothetical protein